jgi:hypothetical protein
MTFVNPADYNDFAIGQTLELKSAVAQMENEIVTVTNKETGKFYNVNASLTQPEKEIILAGGKINQIKGE